MPVNTAVLIAEHEKLMVGIAKFESWTKTEMASSGPYIHAKDILENLDRFLGRHNMAMLDAYPDLCGTDMEIRSENTRLFDELWVIDDHVSACIEAAFDIGGRCGIMLDKENEGIEFYVDYYPATHQLIPELIYRQSDGSGERITSVDFSEAEMDFLLRLMNEAGLQELVSEMEIDAGTHSPELT